MFFLKGLDKEERQLLRDYLSPYEVDQNQTIYYQKTPAEAVFFIEVGTIKLTKKSERGTEETVGILKSGEFFGEEAVLGENNIYQNTAIAMESGILQVLSGSDLEKIMTASIKRGTKILLELSKNYRQALEETTRPRGALVLFYSPRDGGGQSTLAVNTAILLANQTQKPVAFLDADFQLGNAALITGAPSVPNIAGLVQTENSINFEKMQPFFHKIFGVDFLFGPEMPQDAEIINRDVFNKILRELYWNYPFVVVDCKSHIDEQTLLLWDEADRIFLVGTPDIGFLERSVRLNRLFGSLDYKTDKIFGVMSQFTDETRDFLTEFKKILQRPVFTIKSVPEVTRKAELLGKPLADCDPDSAYIQEVEQIVTMLLGKESQPKKKTGGIFSKLASFFSG